MTETVEKDGQTGQTVKFRTVLLQRAQKYFEKTDKELVENETDVSGAEKQSEAEKQLAQEKKQKARRRYFGNIR